MRDRLLLFATLVVLAGVSLFFVLSSDTSTNVQGKKDKVDIVQKATSTSTHETKLTKENSSNFASVQNIKKSKVSNFKAGEEIKFIDEKEESNSEIEKEMKESKRLVSEREKRIEGDQADRPDLFAQYERDIRTRLGKDKPEYPINYKIKELQKYRAATAKSLNKSALLSWMERGPGNVSGRTRGIIIDPDDATSDTWFVGSVGGGVWKTTDAGASWTDLTSSIPNLATSTIAMAASNHNVIYAGTGEGFFNVDQIDGSGIWKTTDKGATWSQTTGSANNPDLQNITRLIVDPADENTLVVSATPGFYYNASNPPNNSGIFRSTDGGTSWTKVYDAGAGGSVEDLISNPENFNTQYATVNSVGVIKSIDGGMTWFDASEGIGAIQRMEIAMAPTDTSTLYFSAQGGPSGSILYVSDDAGASWYSLSDTSGNDKDWLGGQGWYDNTIAIDPYDKNKIYVGGVGIFRLDRVAGTDTSADQVTGVDLENTSSFLGFVNWGGPYNGGSIGTGDDFLGSVGVTASDYVSVELRFGPGKSQKAYRFVRNGSTGVWEYQDYVDVPFEVWDITNNMQISFSFRDWANDGAFDLIPFNGANPQREYMFVNAVPYSATEDTSLAKDDAYLYKNIFAIWPTLASGGTWDPNNLPTSILRINWGNFITKRITATPIADVYQRFGGTSKGVHPDQHNISLVKTNEATQSFRMVVGNDGGVTYSDNKGATFTNTKNGYNTTQFYGVDKMNGGDRYIGGTQDNGSWFSPADPDKTTPWTSAPSGDGFEAVWNYGDGNQMLESSQYNNIYKTTDGGTSWSSAGATNGLSDQGSSGSPFFTKIAKSKQDPNLVFAVGASGVWRSDDFADSWTLTPMPSAFNGTSSFSSIKISLANPQIVWAGQTMAAGNPIYMSTDGGLSFNAVSVYPTAVLGRISSIETDPLDDSTAYALFSFAHAPKILKTTDLGQTWEDISGFGANTTSSNGFPDVAVFSLLVMPYDTDVIWAGTEIGIFESTDGGANWSYSNNGFPAASVYEMVIVNDEVVVATHGRGIWSVSLPGLAGYEPPAATLSPRLSPIAQNPQGALVIPFALRSSYDSTHVNINGMSVAILDANASAKDTTILYPVTVTRKDSVQVVAYKDGNSYKSYIRVSDDKVLAAPQIMYVNNFDSTTADFDGNAFTVSTPTGFSSGAIHSPHPYSDNTNNTYQLLIPIIVASSNAIFSYDDIALVEEGDPGTVFGDANFWDYVIVEGTKDGINWVPLLDGYDARFDPDWSSAGTGDSSLFRNHMVNILDTFNAGDTVIFRFRLFADAATHGWGWAIDNLSIQGTPVPVELASFTANNDENKVTLSWQTATEKNNAGFDIERSSDNKNFQKIANIPGRGTTTEKQSYSYVDNSSSGGKLYYRLKQIDYNGSFTYSSTLEVTAIPIVFKLSQNYPNPFNPTTTIKFQLPKQERVVLEIYNTLGEKVKTLFNDVKDAGYYQALWNGTNNNNITVSTGVYIYRLTAGQYVTSKKMMFLK